MGNIVGDLFSAGSDIYGGYAGADQALTGFNWLKGNANEQSYIQNGGAANNQIAALLGLGGNTAGANNAFQNYLNSSGYKFNLQQGQNAISGNAASKGLLNSGATAKALTGYGQNLGSQYFGNYLGQLSGLAGAGQTALGQVGQAGTEGGIAGGKYISGGYSDAADSLGAAGNSGFNFLFG